MLALRSAAAIASTAAALAAFGAMLLNEPPRPPRLPLQSQTPPMSIPPATCPITLPPSEPFIPPALYPTEHSADGFWLGSEKLWTTRIKGGLWRGYWVADAESGIRHEIYYDKVFWWRKGYD